MRDFMKNKKKKSLTMIYFTSVVCMLLAILPNGSVYAGTTEVEDKVTGPAVSVEDEEEKEKKPEKEQTEEKKEKVNWKIKKKNCNYPKSISRGYGYTIKGKLISERKLSYVLASIRDEKGTDIYKKKVKVNGKKCSISKADEALKFSKLEKGTYYYYIKAVDTKGNEKVVINKKFKVKKVKWCFPVNNGRMGDGWHCGCGSHRGRHYGWDIKGTGKAIHSVSDGKVVYARYHRGSGLGSFGNLVIVYHGKGIYSYYAHCAKIKTKVGKKVKQGDVLATVGATGRAYGAHLHFELRRGPAFKGSYNAEQLLNKYVYKQFNPAKKIKRG